MRDLIIGLLVVGFVLFGLPAISLLLPILANWGTPEWILATIKWLGIAVLFGVILGGLLTWAERRQSAMIQDRLGPNRANIGKFRVWGMAHFVADAAKMAFKEDFVPGKAHRGLFHLAPFLALAPVLIAFCIIPFGPDVHTELWSWGAVDNYYRYNQPYDEGRVLGLQMFYVDFGLLFYFAILTIANYGASIAGWASYNKLALLGGLRASSQMMSYEVTMGLSLMGIFVASATLEPGSMVVWQGPNPLHWGLFAQPLAFLVFLTAAIAETKRAPFDLPEGESEIVGYFIEYSGIRFGMFYLGEFIEIAFIGMILSTVFLGGWQFPFLYDHGFQLFGWTLELPHWIVVFLRGFAFTSKVVCACFLQLLIRWTVPRFRPDQLMHLGWKLLLPLSLANVMVTALVVVWWPERTLPLFLSGMAMIGLIALRIQRVPEPHAEGLAHE